MFEKLKAIATSIGGVVGFVAMVACMIALAIVSLFLKLGFVAAMLWLSIKLFPILVDLMKITVLLFIVLLLPLSIIRRVRPVSGRVAIAIAWLIGLILVIECGLITYQNWGWIGAVAGFFLFGIGLILTALLSSLFEGNWTAIGEVAVSIVFIVLFAGLGNWILSRGTARATLSPRPAKP